MGDASCTKAKLLSLKRISFCSRMREIAPTKETRWSFAVIFFHFLRRGSTTSLHQMTGSMLKRSDDWIGRESECKVTMLEEKAKGPFSVASRFCSKAAQSKQISLPKHWRSRKLIMNHLHIQTLDECSATVKPFRWNDCSALKDQ